MPRKVDPCLGDDGFHVPELFEVSLDEIRPLAEILGIAERSSEIEQLRSDVKYVGRCYHNWHKRGATAFTRAQAQAALKVLLGQNEMNYAAVSMLNGRAMNELENSLLMRRPKSIPPDMSITQALFNDELTDSELRDAAEVAIVRLAATKGPDPEGDICMVVAHLCRVYEIYTVNRPGFAGGDLV